MLPAAFYTALNVVIQERLLRWVIFSCPVGRTHGRTHGRTDALCFARLKTSLAALVPKLGFCIQVIRGGKTTNYQCEFTLITRGLPTLAYLVGKAYSHRTHMPRQTEGDNGLS